MRFNTLIKAAIITGIICEGVFMAACGSRASVPGAIPDEEIATGMLNAGASVHDPFIIEGDNGTFYCYGTHMTAAETADLRTFRQWGYDVSKTNRLFDDLIEEPFDAFSYVGRNTDNWYSVWAPSVIFNKKTEEYVMYFCTTSSYIMSDLCYATSKNIDGPYHYQGKVIYSGFTNLNVDKTNFYDIMGRDKSVRSRYIPMVAYNNMHWPNAIDPAMFYDEDDRLWMVYGSWSGGIFLLELDQETNEPIHPETNDDDNIDRYFGKRLVGDYHHPIEGPYILYNSDSGYYYLFLSYGGLEQKGGYQIRVFRSDRPDGTYVDASGQTLGLKDDLEHYEGYGVKLMGNYRLPSIEQAYMAPGGQSAFRSGDRSYIVYHQRFEKRGEHHEPRVHQMVLNEEGWPCIFPFVTSGETVSEKGYTDKDLEGTVYLLDHGLAVDAEINEAKRCYFEGGVISGELSGSYEVKDGTHHADITIDGAAYHGVLVEMTDEAGNDTFCFSGIGDNNHSLWAVKYLKSAE